MLRLLKYVSVLPREELLFQHYSQQQLMHCRVYDSLTKYRADLLILIDFLYSRPIRL